MWYCLSLRSSLDKLDVSWPGISASTKGALISGQETTTTHRRFHDAKKGQGNECGQDFVSVSDFLAVALE